jgi:hypothetical protein
MPETLYEGPRAGFSFKCVYFWNRVLYFNTLFPLAL